MTAEPKPTTTPITSEPAENEVSMGIPKPTTSPLDMFKSTRQPTLAGVATKLGPLPCYRIADAGDYARLHHNEAAYWSPEFCFVNVPIKGQKHDTLHFICEQLAQLYLPPARVQRFRLALATKPYDVFFLCQVPTQNLDNIWNETNLDACRQFKTHWGWATSRKPEGAEGYKIDYSEHQDAFPEPNWPTQTLDELIVASFAGRLIDRDDHPALLRLRGARQSLS
jgi:hypothetical protein